LVEKEAYLLELARYVVPNPARAGMVAAAGDWRWSTYLATVGFEPAPPFLTTDWLSSAFADERDAAVSMYRRFVEEGVAAASPWSALKNQVYVGSDQFAEQAQPKLDSDRSLKELKFCTSVLASTDIRIFECAIVNPFGVVERNKALRASRVSI
jgi:hypothetical protein